jgi:glutamine cyclotransferase
MPKRTPHQASNPATDADSPPRSPRRWWRRRWLVTAIVAAGILAGVVWAVGRDVAPPVASVRVVNTFPHDAHAYCQGLVYADGALYESTGQYRQSSLRKVVLETGKILKLARLDDQLFGEGLTLWEDSLIQLTWRSEIAIVYDRESFAELRRGEYTGQGWGLTHDGQHLILSDGSSVLRFLDPQTFEVVRRLTVRSRGRRVGKLNELEFVNGRILANIWFEDYIACISPSSGEVEQWIDLRGLWPPGKRRTREDVLNGIAYDPENDRLFVTGKNWPRLFEIEVISRGRR